MLGKVSPMDMGVVLGVKLIFFLEKGNVLILWLEKKNKVIIQKTGRAYGHVHVGFEHQKKMGVGEEKVLRKNVLFNKPPYHLFLFLLIFLL